MYPDAVIFDFDGVIVDTEPIHYRVFQQILEPLGLGYSWDEYQKVYMGFDDRDAFKAAFHAGEKLLDDHTLSVLISNKASIFESVVTKGTETYIGVIDLINDLYVNRVPMAICSGALKSDIAPILAQLSIYNYFKHIVTAEDVPQSKPDPASYLRAKELLVTDTPHLALCTSKIVAIEDTPAGITSAKGAGLLVVGVTNSYPAAKLKSADKRVTVLSELIGVDWF